jgi:hypothetical protein
MTEHVRTFHVKPGIKSTEFWLAVAVVVIATTVGGIEVYRGQLDGPGAATFVAAAAATFGYSHSRARVKAGH